MGARDVGAGPDGAPVAPDVVLFDLGGVLMEFDGLRRLAELCQVEESPALASRWAGSPWVRAFERGACDADAFATAIVRDWNLDLAPSAFIDDFRRWSVGPFPGAVDLVSRLRGTVQTGCLSNTNPVHWQQHLDRWGVVQHLDWTFTSHRIGMTKPDPAVFEYVIRALETAPAQVLLLDDSVENVAAARAAGMRAEHTCGLADACEALRAHFPADTPANRAIGSIPR